MFFVALSLAGFQSDYAKFALLYFSPVSPTTCHILFMNAMFSQYFQDNVYLLDLVQLPLGALACRLD